MAGLGYYPQTSQGWSHGSMAFIEPTHYITKITDHLYLCGLPALTPSRLHQLGATQIISVMDGAIPSTIIASVERHIQIPIADIDYANLRVHFDQLADRIAQEARRGGVTVVHCMAGVSRSASVVLAYLMKYKNMRLVDAYNYVFSVRPYIQPNIGFWRQLMVYEERLYGSRSMRLNAEGLQEAAYPQAVARAEPIGYQSWRYYN